jgi:ferredoxin
MEHSIDVRPKGAEISASEDESLFETLQNSNIQIESDCGGIGSCGKCVLHILQGEVSEPTLEEEDHLSEEMLEQGNRLACQTYPLSDLVIEIPEEAL